MKGLVKVIRAEIGQNHSLTTFREAVKLEFCS